ncbi:DoxX family protein [Pontiella sulfatireligans]|uniref:DoxX family protein n=1 Tax=Pontiella sulfatireligans TaxID=2750658 RepID=A0A6C2UTS4_9BACT|nr:DoxX family protein [Pontiella sulfatireligans]VGO22634.1 hypothetical protein SCARR_04719 [Pontiella sulfatireligans]
MNMLILTIVKVVACLAFIADGGAKLMKSKPLVEQFHDFRLPLEIMYFIGIIEILGGIALWMEILDVWAFSGLACLMLGAMKSHIVAKHRFFHLLPAAVLFCLCVSGALLANWLK